MSNSAKKAVNECRPPFGGPNKPLLFLIRDKQLDLKAKVALRDIKFPENRLHPTLVGCAPVVLSLLTLGKRLDPYEQ
jgi:hypothetical protein